MRLVSYHGEEGGRTGVLSGEGVTDAGALLGSDPVGLRQLLAADRLGELRDRIDGGPAGEVEPINAPELLPPIPDPDKIVCIGLNYRSHAAEAGIDPPSEPTFFAKFRDAPVPPRATGAVPE